LAYSFIASHVRYQTFHKIDPLFLALLLPIRIGEWYLLLRWVYGNFQLGRGTAGALIAGGVITSFVLDVVGIWALFVLPGGAWIC